MLNLVVHKVSTRVERLESCLVADVKQEIILSSSAFVLFVSALSISNVEYIRQGTLRMVDWRVVALPTPTISPHALLKLLTSIGQVVLFRGREKEDREGRKE